MLSPLRNRFGIPGVISVVALVFAMLGGAYAAQSSDNGKATASAKAKKGPRGPKGPKGATGPVGPVGPQGPDGANGKDGTNGTNGTNGKDGTSVTVTESTNAFPGGHCNGTTNNGKGGSKFVAGASEAYACNGKEGSPWTAGGTLPPGATETGVWTGSGTLPFPFLAEGTYFYPISFSIPLAVAPTVVAVKPADALPKEGCEGVVSGTPTAPEGTLCIYLSPSNNQNQLTFETRNPSVEDPLDESASPAGALLKVTCKDEASPGVLCQAWGTWAVTGA